MKLSKILKEMHESGDFGKALADLPELAEQLEERCSHQSNIIDDLIQASSHLRDALDKEANEAFIQLAEKNKALEQRDRLIQVIFNNCYNCYDDPSPAGQRLMALAKEMYT